MRPKPQPPRDAPFTRPAFALIAFAATALFAFSVLLSVCVFYLYAPEVDFVSFWAAGRMATGGHAAMAYDISAHRAVEETVTHIGGLMPFPYPPPFLFIVSAFAWLPYCLAYILWIAATCGLYFASAKRLMLPRFAFAHPASIVNAMIGQNGFLTAGIFILGTSVIDSQPFAAGLILGLLALKPQLATLVPVALVAGRQWRASGGAVFSAAVLLGLAALVFGINTYRAFLVIGRHYADFMATDRWNWAEQASVFGFFRFLGASRVYALTAQTGAAVIAAAITWHAWETHHKNRAAILAAATLLVPPYVFTYDSLILILPLSLLWQDQEQPWRATILWLALTAPLLGYFGFYSGPNTIPLAASLSLWLLYRKEGNNQEIWQEMVTAESQ